MTSPDRAGGSVQTRPQQGKNPLLASATYSLGFIVQRTLGMILLPLYTRAVTTSQYGTLGLLLSVSAALAVLFSVGLDTAVTRNYFQLASNPAKRDSYISAVWRFLVVYPLAASVALSAIVWSIGGTWHGATTATIALMLVSTALSVAGTTVPLALLRARQDLRGYVCLTAILALLTPALTWLFVVSLHQGVRGWFLAATIANGATFLAAVMVVPWKRRTPYSGAAVKSALVFVLPLLPHFLSHWALLVADRLVISGMVSATSLGIYTLAANLSSPMFALLQAINSGFVPIYGRAGAERGHERALAAAVDTQIILTIAITLAATLVGRTAVTLLTPGSYHEAASLVAWLMLGNGFVGVYFVPMNGATIAVGRRMFAFVATLTAVAVNISLLVIFVPSRGVSAAAEADAVAYGVLLALICVWAHSKPNPVTYRWRPIARTLGLAAVTYVGCVFTTPRAPWESLGVEAAWLTTFGLCLAVWQFRPEVRRLIARGRRSAMVRGW